MPPLRHIAARSFFHFIDALQLYGTKTTPATRNCIMPCKHIIFNALTKPPKKLTFFKCYTLITKVKYVTVAVNKRFISIGPLAAKSPRIYSHAMLHWLNLTRTNTRMVE